MEKSDLIIATSKLYGLNVYKTKDENVFLTDFDFLSKDLETRTKVDLKRRGKMYLFNFKPIRHGEHLSEYVDRIKILDIKLLNNKKELTSIINEFIRKYSNVIS